MSLRTRTVTLAVVLLATTLAGCADRGASENVGTGVQVSPSAGTTPATGAPVAQFQVEGLAILAPDGSERELHEDDENATIRYTVRHAETATAGANAFVTFLLNGQVVDTENLRLEPGAAKSYERVVQNLRDHRVLKAEVRAGPSYAVAETPVLAWPRMGEELPLGPLVVRLDQALVTTAEGDAIANFSVHHAGPAEAIRNFRVKMICVDGQGDTYPTTSARAALPALGENVTVEVKLQDCAVNFYGLEFKADGDAGKTFFGRILLVPHDWRPSRA